MVALSATVVWEPAVACVPVQPPEAVQVVALVADHVRVEVLPLLIEVGFADIDTDGGDAVTRPSLTGPRCHLRRYKSACR